MFFFKFLLRTETHLSGVGVDVGRGCEESFPASSALTFDMLTKTVLNGSGHTLENIFKCYFFEGIENIYNDTHVDRRENKKLYNYQAKKMCMFCSVVSYLLLFCDKFPDSESSMDYYKYQ